MKNITAIFISFFLIMNLFFPMLGYSQKLPTQGNWKTINNGLYAGIITDIAVNSSDNTLWASTIRGGVYTSPMNNFQWRKNNHGLSSHFVHSLHHHDGLIFAGTDDFIFGWDRLNNKWIPVDENLKQIKINAFFTVNNQIILAASNKGIYRSEDKGITWQARPTGNNVYNIQEFIQHDENNPTLFAHATGRIMLKSHNFGLTWENDLNAIIPTEFNKLIIDYRNSDLWYAATMQQGFMFSNNAGRTWKHFNDNLNNLYISDIYHDQSNSKLWISTYDGIYFADTESFIWKSFGQIPVNSQINTFKLLLDQQLIFTGTQGNGIFYSTLNAPNWQSISQGLDNAHIRVALMSSITNDLFIGTWGAGLFRSHDKGISWEQINHGMTNPFILCLADNHKGQIYAGTFNGGLFATSNNGQSWEEVKAPTFYSKYVYSIAIDPKNHHRIYVGTHDGIFRSVNNGESWSKIGPGNHDQPAGDILHISIDPGNSQHLFVSTNATGIYTSKDGGDSWIPSNAGLNNRHVTKTTISPNNSNIIYASTFGSGIFISRDKGASWTPYNNGLSELKVYDITMERHPSEHLFIATENGLYHTNINDNQWELMGSALNRKPVRTLIVDSLNNLYLAGTYGNGMYTFIEFLPPPILVFPKEMDELFAGNIKFQWSIQKPDTINLNQAKIILQISEYINFSDLNLMEMFSPQTIEYVANNIIFPHQTYYWRVGIAETENEDPVWSKINTFYTVTLMVLKVGDPLMLVNGNPQEIDLGRGTVPIIKNNRTFLPIRSIVENLGAKIEWNPSTRTIRILLSETIIEMTIDRPVALVNGKQLPIDSNDTNLAPFIQNERTMLPLRFIAETLNVRVEWEGQSQSITLIYPDNK